jgi:3-oxoadipate enol-lactonase
MAFAEIDGLRIHYELSGDAGKPVLVLSHSLGVAMTMWEPQLKELGFHFRLLRYDTRGHGRSDAPTGPYSVGDLGADVVQLMDALGIEKAHFCGLSMGGVIGQWLGVHASGRLDKLVLANTAAKIGNVDTWNARIQTVGEQGLGSIIEGTLERWFTAGFRESRPEKIAAMRAMLQATSAAGYAACCAAIRDADFRADLGRIQSPTLILCGKQDPVTSIDDGRWMAERIAGSKLVELNAAHLSNIEDSVGFNQSVLDFLLHD